MEAVTQVMRSDLMMQNLLLTDFTSHILEKVHTLLKSHLFLEYFESILPFSQWNDTYLRIWVHQGQEIYLLCFLAIASSIVNEVVTFMLLEEKEMKGGQWGLVNFTFWPILYCGKRLFFIYYFFFLWAWVQACLFGSSINPWNEFNMHKNILRYFFLDAYCMFIMKDWYLKWTPHLVEN